MDIILDIALIILATIGGMITFFGLIIAYLIWIDKLTKYTKKKWCYLFHKKSLNIIVTSVGSVSYEYCNKCQLKH